MIAETLAGISLVKASVDFIKSNIDTAKDIGEIASAVDGLFRGADEVEKKRSRKAGVGIKDQFGIQSVAQEVIDARLAQEAMQEMKNMINMRFGPDTWQSIVDLRAKRIQEEKERIAEAKRVARQKQKETEEAIKQVAMIGGVIVVAVALFVFLISIL
tara:strand:+ start:1105 stop:1578 length:474 start_codon:yes stop_codon:yes gene_type:complete